MNRAPTSPALTRTLSQPGAKGMKRVATGLLVVMAAIFFAARRYEAEPDDEALRAGGSGEAHAVTRSVALREMHHAR